MTLDPLRPNLRPESLGDHYALELEAAYLGLNPATVLELWATLRAFKRLADALGKPPAGFTVEALRKGLRGACR